MLTRNENLLTPLLPGRRIWGVAPTAVGCIGIAWMVLAAGMASSAYGQTPPPKPISPAPAEAPKASKDEKDAKAAKEAKPAAALTLKDDLMDSYSWAEATQVLLGKYVAKAESEGFPGAASLFRATARSLQILSSQYADSIKKLGETPVAKPEDAQPEIKTTKDNLKALATRLTSRRTGILSDVSTRQRSNSNREATKTFRYEREALTELGRFATDAADSLEKLKSGKREYFVSRPCGYVTDKLVADKCPVCKTGRDQFEKTE